MGLDFLDKFLISIDTTNRNLRINSPSKETIIVNLIPMFHPGDREWKVVSGSMVQLAPRSLQCIEIRINDLKFDLDGCVEGLDSDNPDFLISRSLHSVEDGLTLINCVNVTDKTVTIQKNQ